MRIKKEKSIVHWKEHYYDRLLSSIFVTFFAFSSVHSILEVISINTIDERVSIAMCTFWLLFYASYAFWNTYHVVGSEKLLFLQSTTTAISQHIYTHTHFERSTQFPSNYIINVHFGVQSIFPIGFGMAWTEKIASHLWVRFNRQRHNHRYILNLWANDVMFVVSEDSMNDFKRAALIAGCHVCRRHHRRAVVSFDVPYAVYGGIIDLIVFQSRHQHGSVPLEFLSFIVCIEYMYLWWFHCVYACAQHWEC